MKNTELTVLVKYCHSLITNMTHTTMKSHHRHGAVMAHIILVVL